MQECMVQKKRLEWIDCMRGITMLLVVYGHSILPLGLDDFNCFNDILCNFRMPLFFFVSGFFAYRVFDRASFNSKIKKRIYDQLFPTLFMLVLYTIYTNIVHPSILFEDYGYPIIKPLFQMDKAGFWFTLVMVEYFLLLSVLNSQIDKMGVVGGKWVKMVICLIFSSVSVAIYLHTTIEDNMIASLLSLRQFIEFLPFYCMGMIAKIHKDIFLAIAKQKSVFYVGFPLSIFCYYYFNVKFSYLCGILGVFAVSSFFYNLGNICFNYKNKIGNKLAYVGTHTLPIYLLHWFVLELFYYIDGKLIPSNNIIACAYCLLVSSIVVVACLVIERYFMKWPKVYKVMFGELNR